MPDIYSPEFFFRVFIFLIGGGAAFSTYLLHNSMPNMRQSLAMFLTGGMSAFLVVAWVKVQYPKFDNTDSLIAAAIAGGILNPAALPQPTKHLLAGLALIFIKDKKRRTIVLEYLFPKKKKTDFEATGAFSKSELAFLSEEQDREADASAEKPNARDPPD